MFFYFVKKGDNLSSIAKEYNVSIYKLIEDNDLDNKNELSIGECLIINPNSFVYKVNQGDTLTSISKKFHVTVEKIKKDNSNLNPVLHINDQILIKYDHDKDNLTINGYAYDGTSLEVIKKTLPNLTYLSIFAYKVDNNGDLNTLNEDKIISLARDYDVAPIMVVTNIKKESGFSSNLASSIINDDAKIDTLFNNILNVLKAKNYYGVNIDFEYVYEKDKASFERFIKKAYNFFKNYNYLVSTALAPKTSDDQSGLLYEAHNYETAGRYNDLIILMTYEWGYTYGDSLPVSPLNKVESVVNYAVSRIAPSKLLMGVPNYGYDFVVPRVKGIPARSLSLKQANKLAFEKKAEIKYTTEGITPYFIYYEDGIKHEVQFDNAYSFYKKLELVDKYNLKGISIWTISTFNTQYHVLINNLFTVDKIL